MNTVTMNWSAMTSRQLVDWHNRHAAKPVKKFENRAVAEKRCSELMRELSRASSAAQVTKQKAPQTSPSAPRPEMRSSLALDRTLLCETTGETWKNAFQMWRERPDWMTSSQVDRLTSRLYSAAKNGEHAVVQINGRAFKLLNAPQKAVAP